MTDLKALIDAYVDAKIAATNSNVDNWERDKTRLNKAEANLTGYLATLSAAPFDVFGQEAIDAAMENERTAQQFRDGLVASPSPPALDGAERDAVIEEIAKHFDRVSEEAEAQSVFAIYREIASEVRCLKETP
jgi:hypothetical protein